MTKDELNREKRKLFQNWSDEEAAAMKKAKKEGTWKPGLDGNRELFTPIRDKYFKKAQKLWEQYQREKED